MDISIIDLLKLNNANIVDIRRSEKYNDNHIRSSINIPYEKLITNPSKYLSKNEKYYLYCQRGITSKKCCEILNSLGYNAVNIIGGYEAYILNKTC